ncbi:sodium:proton exchanger [Blastococcus sp. MG754426]|uniref:cation:proton antiporter domain-containing protein n=1 Tax=unclassified Blastococcus TaxID=2619396 RepID=UPI001EF042B6|nr:MULTISPECIES: cation:proton antiporter [unclassified Blastococcus]MCF6507406.1 sodium:proton exchanger [Blastococcus sp. MG754426]MCF6512046.1 sodium:proton exchanger [Blastococcus sp. MG754427]MCF6734913.1 sodium:proton exchanger [Blastococcus sp. KM273129]
MTVDVLLAAAGALALVAAAWSTAIRRLPVSEPLIALGLGVLLGPAVLDLVRLPDLLADHAWLHTAARLLLAVSVMSIALRYPFHVARSRLRPVALLLVVVMPVMALVSTGLAAAVLGAGLGVAALLGAALAPTDPVLASNVATGEPAEQDIPGRDRQLLSLESGANDGLALPLVLVAVAVAGPLTVGEALLESLWQVVGAVLIGVLLGWLGGRALRAGADHGSADPGPELVFTVVLAFAVLGLAGLAHVDGILAVFVCGLAFNAVSTGRERTADVRIDEAVNRFVVLPLFLAFGALLPWAEWRALGWSGVAFAVAVLLLRRPPVVYLLRRPLGLGRPDAVHLGWFGPIGISALFYLTLESERLQVDPVVLVAGSLVVAASTVVHGLTATPGRVVFREVTAGRADGGS